MFKMTFKQDLLLGKSRDVQVRLIMAALALNDLKRP